MFLHCASDADYLYVNAKESLAENAARRTENMRQAGRQILEGDRWLEKHVERRHKASPTSCART